MLTGIIYATTKKDKYDITSDAINAVTIKMIEGYEPDGFIESKIDGKKYQLCLKEL